MEALKKKFREGRQAEAIAECEARLQADPGHRELKRLSAMMNAVAGNYARAVQLLRELRDPAKEDADTLFNLALCERELGNIDSARLYFEHHTVAFPRQAHGWAGLAECCLLLNRFTEGLAAADRAIALEPTLLPAWTTRASCQKASGQLEHALASYKRALQIRPSAECWLQAGLVSRQLGRPTEALESLTQAVALAPDLAELYVARGDLYASLREFGPAVADYRQALERSPADDETLRKAAYGLLEMGRGIEALELCRSIAGTLQNSAGAQQTSDWVLSQLVPNWHVPMINEHERNSAYFEGMRAAMSPEKVVFEIGTGSGLLAMMAARHGAGKIYACESVDLIADTARRIVARNGFQDRITVLAKASQAVQPGIDLPAPADVLVHEIFSSDLLGEGVLPAIEDAKQRLLKPQARIVPAAASIMIALVGGEDLGRHLRVENAFGFDLGEFNAITPRRRWLYREDVALVLMSDGVRAFRFDFQNDSAFPPATRMLEVTATREGVCHGVVQWILVEVDETVRFENHPSRRSPVTNWQRIVVRFPEPVVLREGSVVTLTAAHDRQHPWFDLASAPSG
jgi:tetratricopeptide (TPR) repeat protein